AFRTLAADPTAPPRLAMSDLADVPERLDALAQRTPRPTLHLAYQTVVRDYLGEPSRARYVDGMRRWVAAAKPASPRIWVELETPPAASSMAIEAHVGSGSGGAVLDLTLAWCGFHPDRITPEADAVRAFTAATSDTDGRI
ncbi:MAG TPA: DUF2332 family protein, partial [Polyangia bacterium]|nr:DUF2332 family protein [Polyangia bacterium]